MAKKKTSKADDKPSDEKLADAAAETEDSGEVSEKTNTAPENLESETNQPLVEASGDKAPDDGDNAAAQEMGAEEEPSDTQKSADEDLLSTETVSDGALASPSETGANTAEDTLADEATQTESNVDEVEEASVSDKPEVIDAAPVKAEQVVVKQGSFGGMLLGGVAAGAVGFAAAYFGLAQQTDPNTDVMPRLQELSSQIDLQAQTVDGLATRLEALPAAPDLSPIEGQLSELAAQAADLGAAVSENAAALAALSTRFDNIDARLSQVEQQPVTEGASEAAVAAYERALQAARDEIGDQRDAMAEQRAELEALIEDAVASESAAEKSALEAMRRAAVGRILAAVENGAAFTDAMSDLKDSGIDVPEPLEAAAETGAPSAAALKESFPDAARAALSASRAAAAETGQVGGFSGFLRNQLGARSLEPREGDDPDAVLSRAEAAVREGRLADALKEIEALPEPGRAALSDWVAQANRRLDAMNAAQNLSEKLN
ncbi:COG4223 family protein [Roseovarius aestuariivivens]|uniref:COG4223 family protein n=1 Tax=Roseovarius aestuariivivens TaxID=1888910 RepID=UPI001080CF97|nr:mitofilin family membrane protein [Roseovarius aestuariivivens]